MEVISNQAIVKYGINEYIHYIKFQRFEYNVKIFVFIDNFIKIYYKPIRI